MARYTEQAIGAAFHPHLMSGEILSNAALSVYKPRLWFLIGPLGNAIFTKFYIVGLTDQRFIVARLASRFGNNPQFAEIRDYALNELPEVKATFGAFATEIRINDPVAPIRITLAGAGVPQNYERGQMIARKLLERWQNKGAVEALRENLDQATLTRPISESQVAPQNPQASSPPAQFGQPTAAPQYQPQQSSGTAYGCLSAALIAFGSGLLLLSTLVIVAMILDKTKTTRDTIGGIVGGSMMILFSVSLIAVGIYMLRLRPTKQTVAPFRVSSTQQPPQATQPSALAPTKPGRAEVEIGAESAGYAGPPVRDLTQDGVVRELQRLGLSREAADAAVQVALVLASTMDRQQISAICRSDEPPTSENLALRWAAHCIYHGALPQRM